MKTLSLLTALFVLVLWEAPCPAAETASEDDAFPESFLREGKLDVDAVVDHFEDMYRSDSSISIAKLIITRPRRTRTLKLKTWTRGDEKALIVILAPAREEGTATLKVGDNLWNYFPRIRRTIRIPPSMMQSTWMGSDFTNDDLVKETSYDEDYRYHLVGPTENPEGWLIRFEAKPDLVGLWNRIDLTVSRDGTIPLRADYYDRKDRLSRTMTWSDVRDFDGHRIPAHLTLIPTEKDDKRAADRDEDDPREKTEIVYLDIDFDVKAPESMFSLSSLERKR